MRIFDSKTKEKVEIEGDDIRLYVCGPTVYDDAHLGHARSAVAFDLLVRTLRTLGKKVTFARNITDIDDKILKKMNDTGKSLEEITTRYLESYRAEMAALGCISPDIEPKATESVNDMIELIETLVNKGFAYATPSGDVYFDAAKDDKYLSLSGHTLEETVSRIEASEKRNDKDFVLWKSAKENEKVSFDSPFGRGRPGWHIECSAMIKRHLAKDGAYQIDIHGGGSDLLFPHHENEAAQSRCAHNQELSKVWMHNGFVTIGGEKMSKSLGNSFFLRDALGQYNGEIIRFYLLTTHYRANFNFSLEDLEASKKRLDKLYRLKKRVDGVEVAEDSEFRAEFLAALEDDLNISKALACLDERVQAANEAMDKNPKDKEAKAKAKAAYAVALANEALGIGGKNATEYFQLGVSNEEKAKIEELITERMEAKKAKDFAAADAIRANLKEMGVELMDTASGTVWEKA
ncbi:MAG: cysteine--tRNA ligase [Campylobacterales bacterium]